MISVIVPVYRVEPYLRKCLDSIINQTYRELEIILVDDCSPDNCGAICEEYAKRDDRIRVIHLPENRGLSAARNIGIEASHSDWIMFVDSDDWVEKDFCEIPLRAAEQNNADLVIFRSVLWERGKRRRPKNNPYRPKGLTSREDAIEFGGSAAWSKLYKRELFITIRYPEGRVYEDIATTHKLIYEAMRIVFIPDILYNHIHRPGSITQTPSVDNRRDAFISACERDEFLSERGCPEEKHKTVLWNSAMGFLCRATTSGSDDIQVRLAEVILNSIPGYPKKLKIRKRMMLWAWRVDKRFFHLICRICGMKK